MMIQILKQSLAIWTHQSWSVIEFYSHLEFLVSQYYAKFALKIASADGILNFCLFCFYTSHFLITTVWIEEVQAEHLATSQTRLVKPHLHSWCSLHILLKKELEVMETPPWQRQSLLLKSFYPCLVFLPVVNWNLQFAEQVVWILISHWDKMTTQVRLFVPEWAGSKTFLFYLAAKKGNICCLQVPTFEFGSHNYRVMFIKLFQR